MNLCSLYSNVVLWYSLRPWGVVSTYLYRSNCPIILLPTYLINFSRIKLPARLFIKPSHIVDTHFLCKRFFKNIFIQYVNNLIPHPELKVHQQETTYYMNFTYSLSLKRKLQWAIYTFMFVSTINILRKLCTKSMLLFCWIFKPLESYQTTPCLN